MNLIEQNITPQSPDYKEIGAFMKRVFPKEELMPMWLLNMITKMNKYQFTAYYDNDLFVGITFTIEQKDLLFIFYIAVNDKVHSKGYGSHLLKTLSEKYDNIPIVLFIETLDPQTDNYDQRLKRLAFYERNGYYQTGIKAGFSKPFVDVLSTEKDFDVQRCRKMMRFIPMQVFKPQ